MVGHYVVTALRNFRRDPLSTAIKLLALSLGLFCFLAAYVFADFVGRADTHWENGGRIFAVQQYSAGAGGGAPAPQRLTSGPVADVLRQDIPELESVARLSTVTEPTLTGGRETLRARGADASLAEIFDLPFVAGDPAALSRPFTAVVSMDLARRMFGGERQAIGQTLRLSMLSEAEVTIGAVIGPIRPPSMLGMPFGAFDALVTLDAYDAMASIGGLAVPPDATPEMAARLEATRRALSPSGSWSSALFLTFVLLPRDDPMSLAALNARLEPLAARHVPAGANAAMFAAQPIERDTAAQIDAEILRGMAADYSLGGLLFGFGALVLAIACLNFANLTTAEAAARGREIGLRKTIGAGRRQIAVQMLVETMMLAGAALVLMLIVLPGLLATWTVAVDWGLTVPALRVGFWAGLAAVVVGVGLLAGAYPALALANIAPLAAARAGAPGGGGGIRALLTGTQFAAASALLTGVFIIGMQNAELRRSGLGASEDPIAIVTLTAFASSLFQAPPSDEVMRAELMADPAILGVTVSANGAFGEGQPNQEELRLTPDANAPGLAFERRSVGAHYFTTLGQPLLAGRDFAEGDTEQFMPQPGEALRTPKAIIDASGAASLGMTPQQAIGQPLYVSSQSMALVDGVPAFSRQTTELEIIGVVAEPPFELRASDAGVYIYRAPPTFGSFPPIVRIARNDMAGGLKHLRATLARLNPASQYSIRFLDEEFEAAFRMYNRISAGLMALCVMAVAIAAMGLFGMASFVVQRRIREIGVRKTLGASSARVLRLLVWDFSRPVILANLISWPVAYVASQAYLNLFATRIGMTPAPFIAALAVSLLAAWIAVATQALGAARAKPADALHAP